MALSDQLYTLAARTKEAEDRAGTAAAKSREELEQDIESAHAAADMQVSDMKSKFKSAMADVSEHWHEAQRKWNDEVEKLHRDMDEKREERDLRKAQKQADRMETDAAYAIEFAIMAVDEAERETLEAALQRKYADELAMAR